MSIQLIQRYHARVEEMIRYGGTRNESTLRKPFEDLLGQYARAKKLLLVAEVEYRTPLGKLIYPDGTLKDALRQDWGYWESKDEADDLEEEIKKKFAKGYPSSNILFEDTQRAILYQGGERVFAADFQDAVALDKLLTYFVNYQPAEVTEFHKAIEQFTADVPALAETLRTIISEQLAKNAKFTAALNEFLELARSAINPKVELADMREMIIQHVLTEDIFIRVFDEAEFHRENVIARKLQEVARTFYKGETKHNVHARIAPYYETINARAAQIYDHHEKQKFLKSLYENFYKAYNPKAADRLGIVYTPDEIVRFMIESADHLTFEHFGKTLGDQGVEILDPATGTGTFITELIEYLPAQQLAYKYEHELHCNEVSILPYYIANLNIEYSYKQKMGEFKEFENICFVDTLDNMGFEHSGKQLNFFGLTDENAERITRQNSKPIKLVIGNPPYNAWQENFNNQNANRAYPEIDQRIKNSYVKAGTAQNQIALYDMYTRFLRWASDRVEKNGIIAFVSNNSFIDSRSYDGFRKIVAKEFSEIHIIDLKGNARTSGERRRREGGNVFDDQIKVGIAIYFLVRKEGAKGFRVYYNAIDDFSTSLEKQTYLRENRFENLIFQRIEPDRRHNWLNITHNDWDALLPISGETKAIFDLYSNGVKTHRDEWVYDFSLKSLKDKMRYFVDVYKNTLADNNFKGKSQIKWGADLQKYLERKLDISFDEKKIITAFYRPFVKSFLYFDKRVNGRTYQVPKIFPHKDSINRAIWVKTGAHWKFFVVGINAVPDLLPTGGSVCYPTHRYANDGNRMENITDWALNKFRRQYKDKKISKEDIFHYVYAVLHHPAYREKYEINLKREFPRIPFYKDPSTTLRASFWQWAKWGQKLMDLHLNYESAEPYPLEREDLNPEETRKAYKARLIAREENGIIEVDTLTTLKGVPVEAWDYKLGTYSALGWILERHKEKKPRDATIREKFNTYRFIDYKEDVIELLGRVTTVSVETMKIIDEMPPPPP